MAYWLLKSEPDEFSIEDLRQKKTAPWDGVRNYQARNFMQTMSIGDKAFFYHSSCKTIGIAGVMTVSSEAFPDPLAINPNSDYFDEKSLKENKWVAVNMTHHTTFKNVLTLAEIKNLANQDDRLKELLLIKKGSRLSVIPITEEEWDCLIAACH